MIFPHLYPFIHSLTQQMLTKSLSCVRPCWGHQGFHSEPGRYILSVLVGLSVWWLEGPLHICKQMTKNDT